jgi:hypothetical protein
MADARDMKHHDDPVTIDIVPGFSLVIALANDLSSFRCRLVI